VVSFVDDGKVYKSVLKGIKDRGALVFMQLDPPRYSPELSGKIAKAAEDAGVFAIAVGGSVGAQGQLLEDTLSAIKKVSKIPTILFPGNIATLSPKADAVYFMSMLNSMDPYWISGAQISAADPVRRMKLEVISTSYIIIEPGMAVGYIGHAKCVPRDKPYLAAVTALAGEYMGSKLVILESGGGAPQPAPPELVAASKKVLSVPLLVAGGVRDEKFAYETTKAGADIIQVGSAVEEASKDLKSVSARLKKLVEAAEKGAKERK
jgi:phosphoglycerol geranylgeranyltransferase